MASDAGRLVGLTAGDLVDPASACWTEAAATIALHSSAPKLLRRRMKLRGREQSFLVSVAPIYLTREERPDGIIVVVHPNGNLAASAAKRAKTPDRFYAAAVRGTGADHVRRERRQQVEKMQHVLDLLCLPDRVAATGPAPATPQPAGNSLSYLGDERHWWPLKRLMDTL